MAELIYVRIIFIVANILLMTTAFSSIYLSYIHVNDKEMATVNAIISGSTILVVQIVGFWVGIKRISWGLGVFLAFISIFMIAFLAEGIRASSYNAGVNLRRFLMAKWNRALEKEHDMHNIQFDFDCCGFNGPEDYPNNNLEYPQSCFSIFHPSENDYLYKAGCFSVLLKIYKAEYKSEEIAAWLNFASSLIVAICTFMLIKHVGDDKRRRRNSLR